MRRALLIHSHSHPGCTRPTLYAGRKKSTHAHEGTLHLPSIAHLPCFIRFRGKKLRRIFFEQASYIHIHTDIQTYIHTNIHTHTNIYTHIQKNTYIHKYIYTHTYTYVHTHIHTYTHTYVHTQTHIIHTYIHTHTYIYTHTYIHIYIHTQTHTYKHTYTYYTYIYIYTHTQTHTYKHTYTYYIYIHTYTDTHTYIHYTVSLQIYFKSLNISRLIHTILRMFRTSFIDEYVFDNRALSVVSPKQRSAKP